MQNIRRILAGGATLLTALMPFHAFLVVWIGTQIGSKEVLQAWKEVLVASMVVLAFIAFATSAKIRRRLINAPNLAAITFAAIALAVSWRKGTLGTASGWFGIKTDLVFLAAFVVFQLGQRKSFSHSLQRLLLATAGLAAAAGLVFLWLSPEFLTGLGYGPETIRPAQFIAGGARRALGTLGGPNQLGAFLILPICLVVRDLILKKRWWQMPLLVVLISCLILTFSRSAFIGAFIGALITAALSLPKKTAKRLVIAGALMSVLGVIAVIVLPDISPQARYLLQHEHGLNTNAGSDDERLAALKNGFAVFMNNPEGLGLGSAGPASFRGPDALITENYYLQIAIETGVAGLIVYLLFEYLVARRLYELRNRSTTAAPLLGALCGIFLVNQFLHGWADSTTALTFWTLSAVSIGEADV